MIKTINELKEELAYFEFEMNQATDEKRVAFLNQCIISVEAKIARLQNEEYDERNWRASVRRARESYYRPL